MPEKDLSHPAMYVVLHSLRTMGLEGPSVSVV